MWQKSKRAYFRLQRIILVLFLIVFLNGGVSLFLSLGNASATASGGNISNRSVQIGSSIVSASNSYTFSFIPATTGPITGMIFQACTTPLASTTCTAPTGLSFSSATYSSIANWQNSTPAFAIESSSSGSCAPSANELCVYRNQTGNESNVTTNPAHQITFNAVTNPSTVGTFFVRISTYDDTTDTSFANEIDYGTVASSTVQTLTVYATIQEQLSFCAGTTTLYDGPTQTEDAHIPTCASFTGTSLNLGVLNFGDTSVSPVPTADGGDNNAAILELETNAANGTSIIYNAVIPGTGTNQLGTLRVPGATCTSSPSNTDQCIGPDTSDAKITAGTEAFGMAIGDVNCYNVTAYTCNFATGSFNLNPTSNYNCNGIAKGSSNTFLSGENSQLSGTTGCNYDWDESGTDNTQIASASSPVGYEGLLLRFAATPSLTTPTGIYSVATDFIATPTF